MRQNDLTNREKWLTLFAEQAVLHMAECAQLSFDKWRITCGFPSTKATGGKRGQAIGQCWSAEASDDRTAEMLISPVIDDPREVAHVIVHELIHAALPGAGHKKPFQKAARLCGLQKPFTATTPTAAFWLWAEPILEALPPYPHAKINATRIEGAPKPQKARMIKAECDVCGYTVRLAKKWIEAVGAPHCPAHGEMLVELPTGDDADDPL